MNYEKIIRENITSMGYKPGYYLNIKDVKTLSYDELKNRLNMELVRIRKICDIFCDTQYFDGCDDYMGMFDEYVSYILQENMDNDITYILAYLNELKMELKDIYPKLAFKIKNLQTIIKKLLIVNI